MSMAVQSTAFPRGDRLFVLEGGREGAKFGGGVAPITPLSATESGASIRKASYLALLSRRGRAEHTNSIVIDVSLSISSEQLFVPSCAVFT